MKQQHNIKFTIILSEKKVKQTTIVESPNNNSCCKRFQRKPKKRKRPLNYSSHNYRYSYCYRNTLNSNYKNRKILNTKVMLIDVMANNVMLPKNILQPKLLINNLKALHFTDYCFELSPHDFGGPPPFYVQQYQLQESNKNTSTTIPTIGEHQLQHQQNQLLQHCQNQNILYKTPAKNSSIIIALNDDNS